MADSNNHHIQVFTAKGKFLHMFGRHGKGEGGLYLPVGVAIDASDMVYVSKDTHQRVSVFTSEGQFVTSFGSELACAGGLAVDDCGVVYVCDWSKNCIQMF